MGIRGLMSLLGMEWIGITVLLIAFVTFCGIVIWALTRPKRTIDKISRIPLDDETPTQDRDEEQPRS